MSSDLIGLNSILLVSLLFIIIGSLKPSISKIIYVALFIRVLLILLNHYVIDLPDSSKDARSYESDAWEWAQNGFSNLSNYYTGPDAEFISWMIAIPYSLFGRSILMAESISLLFGMGSIYLGWLLAKNLWDNRTAIKVAWILALFPSLVLYSVLTMREVFVYFFLLVAMFGVVQWARVGGYKSVILAMFGFTGATFFHGAMFIGFIVFLLIAMKRNFLTSLKLIIVGRLNPKTFIVILISMIILTLYFSNKIRISKIGTFKDSLQILNLNRATDTRLAGEAAYPKWTIINSPAEILYKSPVRALYFLFAPFPWDIKKSTHLIGLIDGLCYMTLVFLILLNLKVIWKDPALRIILLILSCYFFIFGIGVSNFGTGIRHRSKFFIELVILAAPFIPRFIFLKKKLRKNLR